MNRKQAPDRAHHPPSSLRTGCTLQCSNETLKDEERCRAWLNAATEITHKCCDPWVIVLEKKVLTGACWTFTPVSCLEVQLSFTARRFSGDWLYRYLEKSMTTPVCCQHWYPAASPNVKTMIQREEGVLHKAFTCSQAHSELIPMLQFRTEKSLFSLRVSCRWRVIHMELVFSSNLRSSQSFKSRARKSSRNT